MFTLYKVLKTTQQIIQIIYNVSNIPDIFGNNSKCSEEKFPKKYFSLSKFIRFETFQFCLKAFQTVPKKFIPKKL